MERMPAGDAQRIWFPEMILTLRSSWQPAMPFETMVALRDKLDAMLQQIRAERQVRPPIFRCQKCGYVGEGAAPHVSVRAMILAVARFGIAAPEAIRNIEKAWNGYRKQNGLDLNCHSGTATPPVGCDHQSPD
jgi:hypothetical protein